MKNKLSTSILSLALGGAVALGVLTNVACDDNDDTIDIDTGAAGHGGSNGGFAGSGGGFAGSGGGFAGAGGGGGFAGGAGAKAGKGGGGGIY